MAKVTDRGSTRKDSPLFSGGWLFSHTRLTDLAPRKSQDGEKVVPPSTPPEDHDAEGKEAEEE